MRALNFSQEKGRISKARRWVAKATSCSVSRVQDRLVLGTYCAIWVYSTCTMSKSVSESNLWISAPIWEELNSLATKGSNIKGVRLR